VCACTDITSDVLAATIWRSGRERQKTRERERERGKER